ncbi:thiamine-binding protein [Alicyclobacillaceae bacterium I2511]|nr:thiamine-binding protein [Alicyclobacillaceae bacterium I2511]
MAIVAVSIAPLGTGSTGVSQYVAEAEKVLARHPSLQVRLDPMFSNIEGDLLEILTAIQEMHEALVKMGVKRLSTVIKIDDRRDESHSMAEKIAAVEEKLPLG